MKPKLLIVDDDEEIRTQMKWALNADYEILLAEDQAGALAAFASGRPAVTMLDLGLPPRPNDPDEGLATLNALLATDRQAKVVIVSGQGDKKNALQAVGAGAYDFLCKPVDIEELKFVLRRCFHVAELEREYREIQQSGRSEVFEDMIGSGPQMQGVFAFIRKVAATSAPVLILGESGTGKEMAALALHRRRAHKDGPFMAVNCNAIPENLLESELSAMKRAPSPGLTRSAKGSSKRLREAPFFSMRSGTSPPPSR
jgi:two-component system NtrC family response regulator